MKFRNALIILLAFLVCFWLYPVNSFTLAAVPPFKVEVSPNNAGSVGAYQICGSYSGYNGIDVIKVDFRANTNFRFSNAPKGSVIVNGTPVLGAQFKILSDSSMEATLYLSQTIDKGEKIEIVFTKKAGIINPTIPAVCYKVRVIMMDSEGNELERVLSYRYTITTSVVQNVSVAVKPAITKTNAEYTISFATGSRRVLKNRSDDIRIKFPDGTFIPAFISPKHISINGMPVFNYYRDADNPEIVHILSPFDIQPNTIVVIIFKKTAGLINPAQPGNKAIAISTAIEPDWVLSSTYKIIAPSIQNLSIKCEPKIAFSKTHISILFETSPGGYLAKGEHIYVNFGNSFVLPKNLSETSNLTINGNNAAATIKNNTLVIILPESIQESSDIDIEISKNANIVTPSKPGNYKIVVTTDSDTNPSMFTVTITSSVISNVKFVITRFGVNTVSGYDVYFNTGSLGALKAGTGKIFIDFAKGFALPVSIPDGVLTVNGVSASSSVNSSELIIVVPQDITTNSTVTVNISETAGIKNPDEEGEYGMTVYTSSEETPVQSNKVSIIPLPSIQFAVQPASPDGDNGYYITAPTVQIVSSKNGAIYYKLDDGDYSLYSAPIQIPDGDHTLYAYAMDEEGNKGDVVSKEFKVDTKLPQITFDQGSGNIYVNTTHPTLTGKMSEPCSVIQVNGVNAKIDNKNLTFMVSLSVSDKGSLAVVAKALSGMTSSYVMTVYVDTTLPEVKVLSPSSEPFTTTDDTFDIKFTVNEKCKNVEVNSMPVQKDGDGTYKYNANLIEGNNVFYITATDLAGNVTSVPVAIQKVNSIIVKLTIGDKTAYVGDNSVELDSPPIIKNNRTLVPLRFISQAFGAKVQWDGAIKVITIIHDFHMIQLQIDSKIVTVDGTIEKLDSPPIIKNNRTLVPLRFISQAFGAKVQWDGKTKTITITYTP